MDTRLVSLQQSNGLLRAAMNKKLQDTVAPILQGADTFTAGKTTKLDSIQQLDIGQADRAVMGPAIVRYLGEPALEDSFWFPRMGTNIFQNLRIYRDIIYAKQNRKDRLLSGLKGTLWKSLKNKKDSWAYI